MNNRININAVTEKADSLDRSSNTSVDRVLGDNTFFKHLFEFATLNDLMNIRRVSKRWHALATPMVESMLASYPLMRRELRDYITTDRKTTERAICASLVKSAKKSYVTYLDAFDHGSGYYESGEEKVVAYEKSREIIALLSVLPDNLFILSMINCFSWIENTIERDGDTHETARIQIRIASMLSRERVNLLIHEGVYQPFLSEDLLNILMNEFEDEDDEIADYFSYLFTDSRLSLIPCGFDEFSKEDQAYYVELLLDHLFNYYKDQNVDVVNAAISTRIKSKGQGKEPVLNQKLTELFKLAKFVLPDAFKFLSMYTFLDKNSDNPSGDYSPQEIIVIMGFMSLLIWETLKKTNKTNLVLDEVSCDFVLNDFSSLVIFLGCCDLNASHWSFDSRALIEDFYKRNNIRVGGFESLFSNWYPYAHQYFKEELDLCREVFRDFVLPPLPLHVLSEENCPATPTGLYGLFSAETTITTEAELETTETESDDQEPLFKYMRHE